MPILEIFRLTRSQLEELRQLRMTLERRNNFSRTQRSLNSNPLPEHLSERREVEHARSIAALDVFFPGETVADDVAADDAARAHLQSLTRENYRELLKQVKI